MKIVLFLTLLSLSYNLSAQSPIWVKPHAVWHYDYSTTFGGGFIKIEYIRDTILDTHESKMFTSKQYHFIYDEFSAIHLIDSNYIDTNYTWNNADTIFYWTNNHFEILYDFSKTIGDSWIIGNDATTFSECSNISTTQVMNESVINLGGIDYKAFDLYSSDTSYLRVRGLFNARFGAYSNIYSENNFLFPNGTFCGTGIAIEFPFYQFRCFQDDELFYNPSGEDCEYLLHVGINETAKRVFNVYPNPSKGIFTIESPRSNFKVNIFNSLGKLCGQYTEIGSTTTIDPKLTKGIYFIGIEFDGDKNGEFQKFIVE